MSNIKLVFSAKLMIKIVT